MNYIVLSEVEEKLCLDSMRENLHNEDPKVGIFWYNPARKELFGVYKVSLDSPEAHKTKYGITSKVLHVQYWQSEFRRLRFKEGLRNTFPFIGRYQDKPRGRVFFRDNKFFIHVGSWIKKDFDAVDMVAKEFDFDKEIYTLVINSHWDIGSDWND